MQERLAIGLLQPDLAWENPDANRARLADWLAGEAAGLDLVLLPEVFTTGFSRRGAALAEAADGPTRHWLAEQAARHRVTLAGSYLVRDGEQVFNRLLWMPPDGRPSHYDKRHLFTLAGEHRRISAGAERVIVDCQGWRCCLQVCYDLRFPVWSRSRGDYDLLIYLANWPEPRTAQWSRLLPARAIENQAYVAGVNRVGRDGEGLAYVGASQAFDPLGEPLTPGAAGEALLRAELSADFLRAQRDTFPVLDDADDFQLLR